MRVAGEVKSLKRIWTHMNIPCMSREAMIKKFKQLMESIKRLRFYPKNQQDRAAYLNQFRIIEKSLNNGVDVLTKDIDRITVLENLYGVTYGEPEK